jgi:Xaa-Pro dipeptidase
MSKEFFTRAEFDLRQQRVRKEMAAQNLDLLVVISPININYLIGAAAKAYQVFQCLFFPAGAGPTTLLLRLSDVAEVTDLSLADDVRGWGGRQAEDPIDGFRRILGEKGWLKARIGLEMPSYYLSVANYLKIKSILPEARIVDATSLVENLKLCKSPAELAYVKRAAEIADIGIDAIRAALALGSTERQVAAEAHRAMMAAGGESPPSPMNFVSGERTCYAHGLPVDRVFEAGDFMHVEFGGQYRRYCSTIARHFSMGTASARARQIHAVTQDACEAAIAVIKAGVPAHYPHQVAKDVIRKAGFLEYNLHTTGYGIAPGFPPAWGENINMLDDDDRLLEAGMVVSIEPPIFIHSERIGARLIDCVVVHETGGIVLSRHPRDLIVVDHG